jgi:hypothetical protein
MMYQCASCDYEASTKAKFCLKCGAPMPSTVSEVPLQNVAQPEVQPTTGVNVQQEVPAPVSPSPQAPQAPQAPSQSQTTSQPFGTVTVTFTPPPPPPPPPLPAQRPVAQGSGNESVGQSATSANNSKIGLIIGGVVVLAAAIGAFMFMFEGDSKPTASNNPTTASSDAPMANQPVTAKSEPTASNNPTTASSDAPMANQPVTAKDELNILLGLVRDGRWKEVSPKILQLKSLSQVAAGNRQEATAAYTTGAQLLIDNNLQGAATEFEKAVSADPSYGAPRFGLARTYLRNGKLDTAAALLVDGLLITPDSGDGWLAAAEVFAENGKEEAANASLKLALYLAQNRTLAMQFLSNSNETVKSSKFKNLIETALPTLSGVPSK